MPPNTAVNEHASVPYELSEGSITDFLVSIQRQLERGCDPLNLDCSLISRATSSHVSLLMRAYTECQDRGASVNLVAVSPGLSRVLELLDVAQLFAARSVTSDTNRIPLPQGDDGPEVRRSMNFAPTKASIDQAMDNLVFFLTESGVPPLVAFQIQTVFYEFATNIRQHGGLDANALVESEVIAGRDKVVLKFKDRAKPFDLTRVAIRQDLVKAAANGEKRGYGLPMIHRLADSIKYERPGELNLVTIEKVWSVSR